MRGNTFIPWGKSLTRFLREAGRLPSANARYASGSRTQMRLINPVRNPARLVLCAPLRGLLGWRDSSLKNRIFLLNTLFG